ncbi:uncharacterized protein LOC141643899 [Silene latifolia]|uniref:uncharacterized protein LOC141643899 n=1 Tax=Silene latifolia TaxID=37657 RepID=UPI003D774E3C
MDEGADDVTWRHREGMGMEFETEQKRDGGHYYNSSSSLSSSSALNSSNIGFQLLKKQGWKEGTGLGVSEQGRLEPVETYVNKNKRGLGSEKLKKTTLLSAKRPKIPTSSQNEKTEKMSKKEKALTKRMKKILDEEKRWHEKERERAFFREFWPDNV